MNSAAEIIRNQIGAEACMLLGASSFISFDEGQGLQFRIKGSAKANTIRILLDASDTYTVTFWKCRASKAVEVASFSFVYADGLHDLIESQTGLYTSFRRRG